MFGVNVSLQKGFSLNNKLKWGLACYIYNWKELPLASKVQYKYSIQ